jgi:hypothetical protein
MIEKGLGKNKEAARLLKAALELNPKFDLIQSGAAEQALQSLL